MKETEFKAGSKAISTEYYVKYLDGKYYMNLEIKLNK
jgi:hypothetical protein